MTRWTRLRPGTLSCSGVALAPELAGPDKSSRSGPRRTLPLVARYADVWHTWGTPESLAASNRRIDEFASEAGRDPSQIMRAGSLSLDDVDTARREAAAWRDAGYGYLVCGWPGTGAAQVEAFAREVMPDFT